MMNYLILILAGLLLLALLVIAIYPKEK